MCCKRIVFYLQLCHSQMWKTKILPVKNDREANVNYYGETK